MFCVVPRSAVGWSAVCDVTFLGYTLLHFVKTGGQLISYIYFARNDTFINVLKRNIKQTLTVTEIRQLQITKMTLLRHLAQFVN